MGLLAALWWVCARGWAASSSSQQQPAGQQARRAPMGHRQLWQSQNRSQREPPRANGRPRSLRPASIEGIHCFHQGQGQGQGAGAGAGMAEGRGLPDVLTVRPGNHGLTSPWHACFWLLRPSLTPAPDQCMAGDAATASGQTSERSNTEGGKAVRRETSSNGSSHQHLLASETNEQARWKPAVPAPRESQGALWRAPRARVSRKRDTPLLPGDECMK